MTVSIISMATDEYSYEWWAAADLTLQLLNIVLSEKRTQGKKLIYAAERWIAFSHFGINDPKCNICFPMFLSARAEDKVEITVPSLHYLVLHLG